MKTPIAAAAVVALWVAPAAADNMTLSATSPSFTFSATQTSQPINIVVTNDTSVTTPANFMTAWQLNLMLVPESGAVGSVLFNTPATSTNAAQPPNYIFPGSFGTGITVTNNAPHTTLLANDFNSVAAGTQVPINPGANLIQLTVTASSPTTLGLFDLYAVRGSANTGWTNAGGTQVAFANNPFTPSGMDRIAVITAVPEPASCLAAVSAAMGVIVFTRRLLRSRPKIRGFQIATEPTGIDCRRC
jgi:hypothetical protein